MFNLRDYQKKVVDEAPDKWGLWFKQRVGKTPTSIRLACARSKIVIVICPKFLTGHWEKEIKDWNNSKCKFIVLGKEQFRNKYKELPEADTIIWDEVHVGGGNYKSKLFKAVQAYIKQYKVIYVWLLTGTPQTASYWAAYSYGKLLGKDWNWMGWCKAFFYKVRMGRRDIWLPNKSKEKQEELQRVLRSIGTVIDFKDVAEKVDDCDIVEEFSLNKEQKDAIKGLEDFIPVVLYTKIHQIESGVLKGNEYEDGKIIECAKDRRIIELCNEYDKIVIVVRYLDLIDKYKEIIKDKKVFIIKGGQKESAVEVSARAEKEDKAVLIVQGDTVMGYSLKSFDVTVFASLSHSFINYDQCRYRSKATDKKTPNTYIHLLTTGSSVDKGVYDSVKAKQDFDAGLFNY